MLQITKTQAAILHESGKPLIVDEIELPDKLLSHQVLCEMVTSGICGAQINEIEAVKGPDKFLPHLLGHEGYARVLDIGSGVSSIAIGDYGIMHWRPGLGQQSSPAVYKWRDLVLNSGWVTTFNQHCVISENRITRLSRSISDKNLMPLLGCALTTSYGVLTNDVQAGPNDSLLIFGAGGVGLCLIKIARFLKIKHIVIVDLVRSRLDIAASMGASEQLEFKNKHETLKLLESVYKKNPPTIAIDTSGSTDAIELCYEVSSALGSVVLVGVPRIGTLARFHTLPLHFGKVLKGSHGGGSQPHIDIPRLLSFIDSGALDLHDYPLEIYALDDINDALVQLKNGSSGRMIISF